MQLFDPNNPNEKKKMIAAAVLGLAAILVLGFLFFGGSSKKPNSNRVAGGRPTPTPLRPKDSQDAETPADDASIYREINYTGTALPPASEASRNIFAYYVPSPPPVK